MRRILSLFLVSLFLVGCAARLPKVERSQRVIKHYFSKYAKKYPSTAFGKHGVKEVEVTDQKEIRFGVVASEAYLTLGNGELRRIFVTLEKKPLGWRFLSWENPEGS